MNSSHRKRLLLTAMLLIAGILTPLITDVLPSLYPTESIPNLNSKYPTSSIELEQLSVKGRAPKTGYSRSMFGSGWSNVSACSTREIILSRDLTNTVVDESCRVQSGKLTDPYTGNIISFERGANTSALVQIDHVVALSNAWQTGAQELSYDQRVALANDPLELLAVEGIANQQKSDGDAATWLPANKNFRCQYVARQIAVKTKYSLWVTPPEKQSMQSILSKCH